MSWWNIFLHYFRQNCRILGRVEWSVQLFISPECHVTNWEHFYTIILLVAKLLLTTSVCPFVVFPMPINSFLMYMKWDRRGFYVVNDNYSVAIWESYFLNFTYRFPWQIKMKHLCYALCLYVWLWGSNNIALYGWCLWHNT